MRETDLFSRGPQGYNRLAQFLSVSMSEKIGASVYYFRPSALESTLRDLGTLYKLVAVDRSEKPTLSWEGPTVLIADAGRGDLELIEKLAPATDGWRVICLFDGE